MGRPASYRSNPHRIEPWTTALLKVRIDTHSAEPESFFFDYDALFATHRYAYVAALKPKSGLRKGPHARYARARHEQ